MIGTVTLERYERYDAEPPDGVPPYARPVELGYLFLPAVWGHGYAAEACAAALAWFTGTGSGDPVLLRTQVANERAMRLARRLGFRPVKVFHEYGAEQWLGVWCPPA